MSLLPTVEEIATLPRRAVGAFAARCARVVFSKFLEAYPDAPPGDAGLLASALEFAERASAGQSGRAPVHFVAGDWWNAVEKVTRRTPAAVNATAAAVALAVLRAVSAVQAADAVASGPQGPARAAFAAAEFARDTGSSVEGIRADFEKLKAAVAGEQNPVSPDVFDAVA